MIDPDETITFRSDEAQLHERTEGTGKCGGLRRAGKDEQVEPPGRLVQVVADDRNTRALERRLEPLDGKTDPGRVRFEGQRDLGGARCKVRASESAR